MTSLWDSNLFARVTLFPNRQYLGILMPTIPARTVPVWSPILICFQNKIDNTICMSLQTSAVTSSFLFISMHVWGKNANNSIMLVGLRHMKNLHSKISSWYKLLIKVTAIIHYYSTSTHQYLTILWVLYIWHITVTCKRSCNSNMKYTMLTYLKR